MIIKRISFSFTILLASVFLFQAVAQQDFSRMPNEPTYFFNPLAINPAYAGSRDVVSLTGILRKQALFSQNGGAGSEYFSIDAPIANDKIGLGFQAFNNSTSQASVGFIGSAAYRYFVGEEGVISVGVQGGVYQMLSSGINAGNQFKGAFGVGVFYRDFNKYVGIGLPTLSSLKSEALSTTGSFVSVSLPKPIYLSAGYLYEVTEDLAVKGGIVARTFLGTSSGQMATALDFNAMVWYRQKYGVGLNLMNTGSDVNGSKAFVISAEYQISPKMRFGYGYDAKGNNGLGTQTTNPLTGSISNVGQGLHYLMLRLEFDSGNGRIDNFRYF